MDIFAKIEKKYGWKLLEEPVRLNGGFMHQMYRLETDQGNYAMKLLNPFIMQRATAMANFAEAERLERELEDRNLQILPALTFDGRKMQEIDGEYFYLFAYYEGKTLKREEVTEYHCAEMGKALAEIHRIDTGEGEQDTTELSIDWNFYLTELEKTEKRLYEMLRNALEQIVGCQERGNCIRKKLPQVFAICHNDMDCKNVLWKGDDYRIIDLECLSYSNPWMELLELALCWSGYEEHQMDFYRLQAFLQGYESAGGTLPEDWEVLYDCNTGRLEWLEYNIKRVLGIDCGEEEREIGISQVEETLGHIVYYAKMRKQILEYLSAYVK